MTLCGARRLVREDSRVTTEYLGTQVIVSMIIDFEYLQILNVFEYRFDSIESRLSMRIQDSLAHDAPPAPVPPHLRCPAAQATAKAMRRD